MKYLVLAVVSLLAIYSVNCEVFFEEKFPDGKCFVFIQEIVFFNGITCTQPAWLPRVLSIP